MIVFIITYIGIVFEWVHRTIAAITGAAVMVIIGIHFDYISDTISPLTEYKLFDLIDFNTIGLLAGMMIIIAVLQETGFFEYIAIRAAKTSKGSPWLLLLMFGLITAFVSMFLDNVTTVLLMVPVTFAVTKQLEMSPVPIIMTESMFSNLGGVGTMIGDPPNIMISSASKFSFNDFFIRLFPVTVCVIFISLLLLRFLQKRWLNSRPKNIEKIMEMNENEAIKDPVALKKTLAIMILTVFLLSIHDIVGLLPATVALISAGLALLINRSDIHSMLERVEWSTLLFFGALFIMVGTLAHTGFLKSIADSIVNISHGDMIFAALLVLWVSAITSAFIDNIPFTVAMLPVISEIVTVTGSKAHILWWVLAMGVGYGGLATPIGSTPGVVTSGLSERNGEPISFLRWMKIGVPLMLISLIFVSIIVILIPWVFY